MISKSRTRKKRKTSTRQAEEGVKAAQKVFRNLLAKLDPESVKKKP